MIKTIDERRDEMLKKQTIEKVVTYLELGILYPHDVEHWLEWNCMLTQEQRKKLSQEILEVFKKRHPS